MSDCDRVRGRLYSFVVGECDGDVEDAIRKHILSCSVCAEELERMRAVFRLTGMLKSVRPSYDLYRPVAVRIRPHIFWVKVASMAAVAALILILLFSPFTTPVERTPSQREARRPQEERPDKVVDVTVEEPQPFPVPEKRVTSREEEKREEKVAETPSKSEEKEEREEKVVEREEEPEVAESSERKGIETEKPSTEERDDTPMRLARVGEVKGKVRLRSGEKERLLDSGVVFTVAPGDVLVTEETGRVRLDLEGGGYIYIDRGAEVLFSAKDEEVILKLTRGEMYFERDANGDAPLLAVDTGFGMVRSRKARFALKRFKRDGYFIQVFAGEAEYSGRDTRRRRKLTGAFRLMRDGCEAVGRPPMECPPDWASGLRPRRPPRRPPSPPMRMLERFDADGDGKLSLEELKAMMRKRIEGRRKRRPDGAKPVGEMPPSPSPERILERFDTDGDDALSVEELKRMVEEMKRRRMKRPSPDGWHLPVPPRPKGRGVRPPPPRRNQNGRDR